MSAQTIPLHLLKAQLELQLHLSRLLQESGQQWLEHAARNGPERIAETGSEIEGVQQTSSWQELATRPAQAFWRHAPLMERGRICMKATDTTVADKDAVAEEITRPMGRPIAYSPFELGGLEGRARHMVAIAPTALGDVPAGP